MTGVTEALDRLAPTSGWENDWADVLRRAGEDAQLPRARRRPVRIRPIRRRTVLLVAVLAAVIAPLTALAALNHWWFLGTRSGLPRPGQQPIVVTRGSWSGHPWDLVAYPSKRVVGRTQFNGLCWGVTFSGHTAPGHLPGTTIPATPLLYRIIDAAGAVHGTGDGVGCGSLTGIQKPHLRAFLEGMGMPIPKMTFEWLLSARRGYPSWISGVVVPSVTHVVIRFPICVSGPTCRTAPAVEARAATLPAAVPGYGVRLFTAPIPKQIWQGGSTLPSDYRTDGQMTTVSGTNRYGHVVACTDGFGSALPFSLCKP